MALDLDEIAMLVADITEVVEQSATVVQTQIALSLFRGFVKRTPVDTGHARLNWQMTVGKPATGIVKTRNVESLAGLKPFNRIWITNNTPYIGVLEYGLFAPKDPGPSKDKRRGRKGKVLVKDGYSIQAPKGMVRITWEEMKSELNALL